MVLKLLPYFGQYKLFFIVTLATLLFLAVSNTYCRRTGPNKFLETVLFNLPMAFSIFLCVLVFYSSFFWTTFLIYIAFIILVNLVSFQTLALSLEDKTGLGATMFSGFVAMFAVYGVVIVKFFMFVFRVFQNLLK